MGSAASIEDTDMGEFVTLEEAKELMKNNNPDLLKNQDLIR